MATTDLGVWDAIAPWLSSDTALAPLVPLSAANGLTPLATLLPQKIHRRRAPQTGSPPYAIVTGPVTYDHGNYAAGVLTLKLSRFNILVVSATTTVAIAPAVRRILACMESTRGKRIGDWFVNSFQVKDMDEAEAENPKANELGLPAIVIQFLAGAEYSPVET